MVEINNKTKFLELDSKAAFKFASDKLKSKEWNWNIFCKAMRLYSKAYKQRKEQEEAKRMEEIKESFGG